MYITTEEELRAYILRKLGVQIHEVEVTDEQWQDIVNDSYKDFIEYSGDGSVEVISKFNLPSNVLVLSSNILNIKKILAGTSTSATSDMFATSGYAIPISVSELYKNPGAGSSAVESIISTKQALANIRNIAMTEVDWDFNPETKKLVIHHEDFDGDIIFIGDVAEPIELLFDSKFLKLMVESRMLRQWARNMNIKYNVEDAPIVGNGLKLHPQAMNEAAEKLEEEWKLGLEENEWDTYLSPRRLYQF